MKTKAQRLTELREWMKESLDGVEETPLLCDAVEYVMVKKPAEAVPLSELKTLLTSSGVTKRKAAAIVAWRKQGREWRDIWEEASEMQATHGIVSLSGIAKLIRLVADGKHEWQRVEIRFEVLELNEGIILKPAGWKRIRKAFEKGGYEAATEVDLG